MVRAWAWVFVQGIEVKKTFAVIVLALTFIPLASCQEAGVDGVVQSTSIAEGWASNSINAVIFRRNSVVSHGDTQYVAFYDPNATVVLAKRTLGTADWEMKRTRYTGGVADAHNSISIMVDGTGFLHVAWDQHGNRLRYCRSVEPGSLDLGSEMPMTGQKELKVTYPEFYRLPDGNLQDQPTVPSSRLGMPTGGTTATGEPIYEGPRGGRLHPLHNGAYGMNPYDSDGNSFASWHCKAL